MLVDEILAVLRDTAHPLPLKEIYASCPSAESNSQVANTLARLFESERIVRSGQRGAYTYTTPDREHTIPVEDSTATRLVEDSTATRVPVCSSKTATRARFAVDSEGVLQITQQGFTIELNGNDLQRLERFIEVTRPLWREIREFQAAKATSNDSIN